MAFLPPIWDPPVQPSLGAPPRKTIAPRLLMQHYGMDAKADFQDGIFADIEQIDIIWDDIPTTYARVIVTFLRQVAGKSFWMIAPRRTTYQLWSIGKYTWTWPNPGYDRVEAQLVERR